MAYQLDALPQMQEAGESALPQIKNDLPVDNTSTSHIQKRSDGDSIRQRDRDIPGRKDKAGRSDKKNKKNNGKNKDTKRARLTQLYISMRISICALRI